MTAQTDILAQPSLVELARSGNFQAIAYWINQFLIPQGIYARVNSAQKGCVRILVELPPQNFRNWSRPSLQKQVVRFICHEIWKLNSEVIEGVRIVARFTGQSDVLWKQSVRITTPANRQRQLRQDPRKPEGPWHDKIRTHYKMLRTLLIAGATATAFTIGVWFSTQRVFAPRSRNSVPSETEQVIVPAPPPKVVDTVEAALERVSVVEHRQVLHPEDPTITLMFAGDVTLSDAYADLAGDNYQWAFEAMRETAQVDVAMVNLENAVTQLPLDRPKTVTYKADPEAVKTLTDGGIDIVNLANNQVMEYGEPGLEETLETLDRSGIHYVGAGRDVTEARRPEILEVKGQQIAYFGYYTADFKAAEDGQAGTNRGYKQRISQDIQAIRDRVDWVIVNYHWGSELAEKPDQWQIDLAHFTIDQGADLIVGHHSQVLQGAEIYKDRPIAYSLGNFIFGGSSQRDYDTAVLKVSLKGSQMKVEFLPVEVRKYQPRIAQGGRGRKILQQIERVSDIFERPMPTLAILHRQPLPQRQPSPASSDPTEPKLPVLPMPKVQRTGLSEENNPLPKSIEAVDRHSSSSLPWRTDRVVPKLTPSPDDDPEVFITDPFISVPGRPSPTGTPRSESRLPTRLTLPFESVPSPKTQADGRHRSPIDLPRLAYGI